MINCSIISTKYHNFTGFLVFTLNYLTYSKIIHNLKLGEYFIFLIININNIFFRSERGIHMIRKAITFIFLLSLALFAGCERNDLYNNATNSITALLPINLSSLFGQPDIHINVQSTEYASGSTYDFGTIMAGSSSQGAYFSINNRGNADLHLTGATPIQVSGVNAADFSVTTQGTPNQTITSTVNLMFSVNFKPAVGTVGPRSAQIVILSDDPVKGTFVINLQGNASSTPVPDVNVRLVHSNYASGTNYNFGTFMQGTSSQTVAFTLENNGNATLNVSSLMLSGADAGQFNLTGTGPFTIAPGTNVTFSAVFSPVSTGSFSASIMINNSDPDPFESPYVLNLQGTGSATPVPNIDIQSGGVSYPASSSNYSFGAVPVGSSGTATFDIINNGSGNLTLTGSPQTVRASGAEFSVTAMPAAATVIAPGASATFTVTFTPTASSTSPVHGNIIVYSDDPDSPQYYFSLIGSPARPPEIHVFAMSAEYLNGSSHNYGTMEFASPPPSAYFYIQNRGNLDLHLTGTPLIQISGADAGDFSVGLSGTPSTTITSTTGLPFSVMFNPTAATAGTRNATVTILTDDPVNGTFMINLQGTVSTTPVPDINVKYSYADYPTGSNYNFGTYEQGSSSQPVTFTIENRGTQVLNVSSLQIGGVDGSQFILLGVGPFSIFPGTPATFSVIFSPNRSGACVATVSINSDDPDSFENPYILNINGTGSASPVPNIDIQAGGVSYPAGNSSYSFGPVAVGSSSSTVFTIVNNGTGNLTLTGTPGTVQITSAEFSVTAMPAAATVIAPGGTATFTVKFAPTASSPSWVYTNATIKSDDPDIPQYNLFMSGSVFTPIAPVMNPLALSAVGPTSITLAQPNFSIAGNPSPTVSAYIGLDGTISVSGTTVSGSQQGPVDVSTTWCQFNGLAASLTYRIIVVAVNTSGYSVQQIVESTGLIAPVLNPLSILAFDSGSITLGQPTFSVAGNPLPPVQTVQAYIGLDGVISVLGSVVSGAQQGPVDVSTAGCGFWFLSPNTAYRIIVVAQNSSGFSVVQIPQFTAP